MILIINQTIYIPLMDEGTDVARPTQGEPRGNNIFMVLPTVDYDPEDEVWQFLPGSIVVCEEKIGSAGHILIAKRLHDDQEM